jgi:putative (di)nucleoside polyphosphate hydrolase
VFAGLRSDASGDAWQMPQGGIDAGETPEQAALRELAEETGTANAKIVATCAEWLAYDLPPKLAASVWGGRYRGQRQKWFALEFLGTDAEIDLATPHPEFKAWRWSELDALAAAVVPFKRAIYARVAREFAPVARRIARGQ